mmetsp:Transcript_663/g.1742  ORF Transcript_663/g.1742 Transcript_663/m.1742 type:complete len:231 (-) Transcript_663:1024-1716(-)
MEEIQREAELLLKSALGIKVLVTRKRPRRTVFAAEKRRIEQDGLERQAREEAALQDLVTAALAQDPADDAALDPLDREEKLIGTIHELKGELFDSTVDTQQLSRLSSRVRWALHLRAAAQADADLFRERDELAAEVLKLNSQFAALTQEELELSREVRAKQAIARKKFSKQPSRLDAAPSSAGNDAGVAAANAWLHQCLTAVVLESKVNWSQDSQLRELLLAEVGAESSS